MSILEKEKGAQTHGRLNVTRGNVTKGEEAEERWIVRKRAGTERAGTTSGKNERSRKLETRRGSIVELKRERRQT